MGCRGHSRSASAALATLFVAVGLAGCGSSEVRSSVTIPVTEPAAPAAGTVPPATTPSATVVAVPTTDNPLIVTDAEVADLEKQLDEINQLLSGVDADLSQD